MGAAITFDIEDVLRLYGPKLYRVGQEEIQVHTPPLPVGEPTVQTHTAPNPLPQETAVTSGITWRLKTTAPKILFVLQDAEFHKTELTDLLKKIVESLKIDTAFVSFGMISGPISMAELDLMPSAIAVVFDQSLFQGQNPQPVAAGEVFFSHPLATLDRDNTLKRSLWDYLKQVQPKLV